MSITLPAGLTPGVWTIDPSHTAVTFSARHLMVSKVRGRFSAVSGAITIDDDAARSSVEAAIEMASISTDDDQRDGHLRSGEFLDVENHPTMTFRSTELRSDDDDYVLVGELTIKGVTRPVELELEFEGVEKDPWGGTRVGFSAEGEINRKDFGMEWNVVLETGGLLVGEKVKITLDVEAIKS